MRAFKKFTQCFFCALFCEPFSAQCLLYNHHPFTHLCMMWENTFSCVSQEARSGFAYELSDLAFLNQTRGSKITGFSMASKQNRLRAHNQPLSLCSPIKTYLLIAEENNHIITCVQHRAPAGTKERRCRDMTGAAKQQRKHNILSASCASDAHSPTETSLHVSNFPEAGQA